MSRRYPPGTFVVVPQAAIYDDRLTLPALRVLLLLQDHANGHNEPTFLSVGRMADDLKLGTSTVRRARRLLESSGHVRTIRRTKPGRGMTTNYYLVVFGDKSRAPADDRPAPHPGSQMEIAGQSNRGGPGSHMVTGGEAYQNPVEPNPVEQDASARAAPQTAGRALAHDHDARARSLGRTAPAPARRHHEHEPLAGARHEVQQDHELGPRPARDGLLGGDDDENDFYPGGRILVDGAITRLKERDRYTKAVAKLVTRLVALAENFPDPDQRDDELFGLFETLDAVLSDIIDGGATEATTIKALQWHMEFSEEHAEDHPPVKLERKAKGHAGGRP
jgi:hypothetical protein